jgi:hypothetical protein
MLLLLLLSGNAWIYTTDITKDMFLCFSIKWVKWLCVAYLLGFNCADWMEKEGKRGAGWEAKWGPYGPLASIHGGFPHAEAQQPRERPPTGCLQGILQETQGFLQDVSELLQDVSELLQDVSELLQDGLPWRTEVRARWWMGRKGCER